MSDALSLTGRVLLALLFLLSGFDKIGAFAGTAGYIASKGLPMSQVVAGATIVFEVLGGLLLAIGFKARWVAAAFAAFTLLAAFIFHPYWSMPEAQQALQKIMFLKNLAIAGGMLLLVAYGPGRWSVDKR